MPVVRASSSIPVTVRRYDGSAFAVSYQTTVMLAFTATTGELSRARSSARISSAIASSS